MHRHTFEERFPKKTRGKVKRWMVGQYAFGAEARHPFIGAILERLVARTASFEADQCSLNQVLHSTGPDLVTDCYYHSPDPWKTVTMLAGEADPEDGEVPVTGEGTWHRFGKYGRHLLNGGWK